MSEVDITGGTGDPAPSEGFNVGAGYDPSADVPMGGGGPQAGDPGFYGPGDTGQLTAASHIFTGNDQGTVTYIDPTTGKFVTQYQEPDISQINDPAELVSREFTFFGNGTFRSPGQILPGGQIVGDTLRTGVRTNWDTQNPTAIATARTDAYIETLNRLIAIDDYARANPYHDIQQDAVDQDLERQARQYQQAGEGKLAFNLTGVNPIANFKPDTQFEQVNEAIQQVNSVVNAEWTPYLQQALLAQGYTATASGFVPPSGISTNDFNAGLGNIWERFVAEHQGVFDNYRNVTGAIESAYATSSLEIAQAAENAGQSLNVGHPLILPLVNADLKSQFITTIDRPGNIVAIVPQSPEEDVQLRGAGWVTAQVVNPNDPRQHILALVPPSATDPSIQANMSAYGLSRAAAGAVSIFGKTLGAQAFEDAFHKVVPVLAQAFAMTSFPGLTIASQQTGKPIEELIATAAFTPLVDIPLQILTGKTLEDHLGDGTLAQIAVSLADQVNLANIAMALLLPEATGTKTVLAFTAQTAAATGSSYIDTPLPQAVQDLLAMAIAGHLSTTIPDWRTAYPSLAANLERRIDAITQGTSSLLVPGLRGETGYFSFPLPGDNPLKRAIEGSGILGGKELTADAN